MTIRLISSDRLKTTTPVSLETRSDWSWTTTRIPHPTLRLMASYQHSMSGEAARTEACLDERTTSVTAPRATTRSALSTRVNCSTSETTRAVAIKTGATSRPTATGMVPVQAVSTIRCACGLEAMNRSSVSISKPLSSIWLATLGSPMPTWTTRISLMILERKIPKIVTRLMYLDISPHTSSA